MTHPWAHALALRAWWTQQLVRVDRLRAEVDGRIVRFLVETCGGGI